jgi:hypothetical protein
VQLRRREPYRVPVSFLSLKRLSLKRAQKKKAVSKIETAFWHGLRP